MSQTTLEFGYPEPGPQEIPVDDIMNDIYFLTQKKWDQDRVSGNFDYVVIGSSFCALGFAYQMLANNPNAKILLIERGAYFHPEHFQNLPPAYCKTVGGKSETFPWKITEATHNGTYIHYQHGMNNFFGGRSSFWSAWCPEPTDEEMKDWPVEVIQKVRKWFPAARNLLNVIPADEISQGTNDDQKKDTDTIFGELQHAVYDAAENAPQRVAAITRVLNAPLAVKADNYRYSDYEKFSASGPLLNLALAVKYNSVDSCPLKMMIKCLVKRINHDGNGKAMSLDTDRGDFKLGNAKLILAMGTLPPTTLMLNSFSEISKGIGERFSSHFISAIIARTSLKRKELRGGKTTWLTPFINRHKGKLEMAAVYVAGEDANTMQQFHIQLTTVIDQTPIANVYDTMRHLPDVVAAPTLEQLMTSKDHAVFVCASLGQIDHNNDKNYYRINGGEDITCNATLQVVTNDNDTALWDIMDDSTFSVLEECLSLQGEIEYWNPDTNNWQEEQPTKKQIRVPGLVHESSTMWIGKSDTDPVDLNYKFRGVDNVYLTGGALWPTGASWNPTCAMTALAMDLADILHPKTEPATKLSSK